MGRQRKYTGTILGNAIARLLNYSERLNKIVIARSAATRQSHEIHFVGNDTLFNVNLIESFNIVYELVFFYSQ